MSRQLELPSSLSQAAALAEDVARLEGSLQCAYEEIAALKGAITVRDGKLAAEKAYILTLQAHIASLESRLRFGTDFTIRGLHPPSSALPSWLDTGLKALIREAHPDRWHNQPAEKLSHEIVVALNDIRARIGEGHV